MRKTMVIAATMTALLLSSPVAAESTQSHEGVFLRLTLGAGAAVTENRLEPNFQLRGATGFFSLDLGGTLHSGLALHGRLSVNTMVDPTLSIEGRELGEVTGARLSYGLLGVGATYYFPSNLYLTGVVGLGVASLEIDGSTEYESETGIVTVQGVS